MKSSQTLRSSALLALVVVLPGHSPAAITPFAEYHLGEAGSMSGATKLPQDSSGNNRHFSSNISGGSVPLSPSPVTAPGSTHYIDTRALSPDQGWYSSNTFSGLATDNFAVGVYASAPSLDATPRDVIALGGGTSAFKISLAANGWAASSHNASWIGPANGYAGTFTANQWVHLALIRKNGVTTFYIDGVAKAGTYNGAPAHNSPHLSVNPGGTIFFNGRIDEARVVTFAGTDTEQDILAALGTPPLPIRYLVQDGENSYPAVALAAGLTSEVRPGSGLDRDFTTVVNPDGFTVSGTHTLKVLAGPSLQVNTPYDIFRFTASGAPTLNLGAFDLDLPPGAEATLAIDSAAAPDHYVTLTFQDLGVRTWNGTAAVGGSTWNTTTPNWKDVSLASVTFANGDSVVFDENAAVKNVSIAAGEVQPTLTEFAASSDYAVSGPGTIGGTGTLQMTSGKVTLSTAVNLSGAGGMTILPDATLQLENGGSLGSMPVANSGTMVFNPSAVLDIAAPISSSGTLTLSGSGTTVFSNTVGGAASIDAGATMELNAAVLRSHPTSNFTGAGTLRKTGANTAQWGASTATFALDPGALIDVQAGTLIGGSSNNEIWTENKADLHVEAGAAFESVEATVLVDALSGSGTLRAGYPGFANAGIVCGVADGSGSFGGAMVDYPIANAIGRLTKRGTGTQTLAGPNTYTGNTTVEAGALVLDVDGSLTFKIGANGVSNRITGTGAVTLDGVFVINLSGATLANGNSWNLVDVPNLTETYGDSFLVSGFTGASGVWTLVAGANTWTFTESTGNLTLAVGGGYSTWATANADGQGAELDFDADGVKNGIEYFLGETGSGMTVLPGPVTAGGATTVTWDRDPAASVTSFGVQFSTSLTSDWQPVPGAQLNLSDPAKIIYTFPAPLTGKRFVRLSVTP
ncbi:autotransporter-associated beta strand repeat-containing protein [Luteolibacter arcticus]|uniref:Autotransporter-associated beta strand repeat-containing protein n=1 Tax=Luteolibacter arcticus TaxID=1581411 RepID=A0ABT3GLS2_9BACT|nr:LamG-like jellyroll fold domain-containing protein [Luteolibacter arcticus]MCW1924437.1 autotransporter-associated beta strand repeat-containing protein [Luteolibacter arcticus]